jgi:hypothetical protein
MLQSATLGKETGGWETWFRTVLAPFPDVLHFMSNHVIEAHMSRVDRAG